MSSTRAAFDAGLCAWLVPWVLPRDADALACAALGGCAPAAWAAAKRAASVGPWARWLRARLSELEEGGAVAPPSATEESHHPQSSWYLSEMLAADGLWRRRQDAAHPARASGSRGRIRIPHDLAHHTCQRCVHHHLPLCLVDAVMTSVKLFHEGGERARSR